MFGLGYLGLGGIARNLLGATCIGYKRVVTDYTVCARVSEITIPKDRQFKTDPYSPVSVPRGEP